MPFTPLNISLIFINLNYSFSHFVSLREREREYGREVDRYEEEEEL